MSDEARLHALALSLISRATTEASRKLGGTYLELLSRESSPPEAKHHAAYLSVLSRVLPAPPERLVQTGASVSTVTVEWDVSTSGAPPASFEYRLGESGTVLSATSPLTITDLPDENSPYDVYIRSRLNTNVSTWVSITAYTSKPKIVLGRGTPYSNHPGPWYETNLLPNMVDGNPTTRTQASASLYPGAYYAVDLGSVETFHDIDIADVGFPAWALETSIDGLTWTRHFETKHPTVNVTGGNFVARHIRVLFTAGSPNWWFIGELGPAVRQEPADRTEIPLGLPIASGVPDVGEEQSSLWDLVLPPELSPSSLQRGYVAYRTPPLEGEVWLGVDLGGVYPVKSVQVGSPWDLWSFETSLDGETWTPRGQDSGGLEAVYKTMTVEDDIRYYRIVPLAASSNAWFVRQFIVEPGDLDFSPPASQGLEVNAERSRREGVFSFFNNVAPAYMDVTRQRRISDIKLEQPGRLTFNFNRRRRSSQINLERPLATVSFSGSRRRRISDLSMEILTKNVTVSTIRRRRTSSLLLDRPARSVLIFATRRRRVVDLDVLFPDQLVRAHVVRRRRTSTHDIDSYFEVVSMHDETTPIQVKHDDGEWRPIRIRPL